MAAGLELTSLGAKRRQAALPPRILLLTGAADLGRTLHEQLAAGLPSSVSIMRPDARALSRIASTTADLVIIDITAARQIAFRNSLIRALCRSTPRRSPVLLVASDLEPLPEVWAPVLALSHVSSVTRPVGGAELLSRARALLSQPGNTRALGVS